MAGLEVVGREGAEHQLAHAVVVGLDDLAVAAASEHEVLAAQGGEREWVSGRPAAAPARRRSTAAGDRGDLEQGRRAGSGRPSMRVREDAIEGDLAALAGALAGGQQVAHELADEQRVALGLARDLAGARAQVGGQQGPRARSSASASDKGPMCSSRRSSSPRAASRRVLSTAPLWASRCGSWRSRAAPARRAAQQIGEQGGAVAIAPLQVVDVQHQGAAVGQARQQSLERREGRRRSSRGSGMSTERRGAWVTALTRCSTGNTRGQGVHVARHQLGDLGLGQAQQVLGERVDQRVERLERHRLALVAATGEHHRGPRCRRAKNSRTRALLPMPLRP